MYKVNLCMRSSKYFHLVLNSLVLNIGNRFRRLGEKIFDF